MNGLSRTSIVCLLCAFALVGCAAPSQPPKLIKDPTPGPSAITPVRADRLMPRNDATGSFEVMVGPNKGKIRPFTRTFKNNHWIIVEKGDHRGFYRQDSEGRIILDREDDFNEQVQVDYKPGIVILPPVLGDGDALPRGKVQMIVKNLKTGKIRDRGTCTYQVTAVTEKKITTPAGTFRGYVVEQKRHLNLSLAKVDLTIHTGYVPGKGTVMDALWQTMHAVGLITIRSHHLVERAR